MEEDSAVPSEPQPEHPPSQPSNTTDTPNPLYRSDTLNSQALTDTSSKAPETCRICRGEGSPDEPLFYPCKCSGSIKFVHQECLMEWLSHSHKKHCELCKTPFRFTKLYDANMPPKLPWRVFVRRACWHVVQLVGRGCRSLLVAGVWLGLIPWVIRWVWRWYFWIADAAWARKAWVENLRSASTSGQLESMAQHIEKVRDTVASGEMFNAQYVADTLNNLSELFSYDRFQANDTDGSLLHSIAVRVAKKLGYEANATTLETAANATQTDTSVLSSWSYLSSLTPSDRANRIILDIFEGQIITCVVICGFILVFLIREWVVQQQPLVNLDNLGNVQQQLREAADRVQADNERLRRQQEMLDQARRRLEQLEHETEALANGTMDARQSANVEFIGWSGLEQLIDLATESLQRGGDAQLVNFRLCAQEVTKQIRAAGKTGVDVDEFTEKVYQKLAGYSENERREWEAVLIAEADKKRVNDNSPVDSNAAGSDEQAVGDSATGNASTENLTTLQTQRREAALHAQNVQRYVQESQGGTVQSENGAPSAPLRDSNAPTNDAPTASAPNGDLVPAPIDIKKQEMSPSSGAEDIEEVHEANEPLPITNAGPDAKINIKRRGQGKLKVIPEPKIAEKLETDEQQKAKLTEQVKKVLKDDVEHTPEQADSQEPASNEAQETTANEDNPFHPDGPEPERRNSESFSNRVASVFREEFGLEEAEDAQTLAPAARPEPRNEALPEDEHAEETPPQQQRDPAPGFFQRLTDWLWGDIEPRTQEPAPAPAPAEEVQDDQRREGDREEAPFVPVQDGQPNFNDAPNPEAAQPAQPQHDPEVLAAAQQAGLDPEAVDDAEDLEGIFELIGMHGPLIGLLQTSAFCTLLVACSILCAVILPYAGGKIVLNLLGNPAFFLVKMPLQAMSGITDLIIDLALLTIGSILHTVAATSCYILTVFHTYIPRKSNIWFAERVLAFARGIVTKSFSRLVDMFSIYAERHSITASVEVPSLEFAFLHGSAHAHASLKMMQERVHAVLGAVGSMVTSVVQTISSGEVVVTVKEAVHGLTQEMDIPATLKSGVEVGRKNVQPLTQFISGLRRGTINISDPEVQLDSSLVYWNSSDRALAILAGYAALAALAVVYVALDTPITKSEAGRRTEKMIRDTFRQAGGVLKVILIISIEMLLFPLYCGILLDIAFLPLFKNASLASRWDFATRSPNSFCFVHWFVGTCYMFHFALFVGMCRKILRKGVLWFIRDPDDPTFHPVRDVLERNVATQLRKIAFSALVYGALVILCLGGVVWMIGQVFDEVFPIQWISTEPILEFPLDLFMYNFITPLVVRLFKPSDAVNAMYAWWLKRCARELRLSHFLFDDRKKDEEGHYASRSWWRSVLSKNQNRNSKDESAGQDQQEDGEQAQGDWVRNGKYVLTPCIDQYRPPKPGEAFLHADDDDVYIADKDGKKNEHFAKVYVPPGFRLRITAFMMCLWMFSAMTGLCVTLLPLIFGRWLFKSAVPNGTYVNDIYAYSSGAYVLGGALFTVLKTPTALQYLKGKTSGVDLRAWIEPTKRFTIRALKCLYFYGFIGVALPTIFALLLQFYVILPLHTWFVAAASAPESQELLSSSDTTDPATTLFSSELNLPPLAEHTVHLLQDYALGLVYLRIAGRLIIGAPTSRAAEAFRRITADGYLNPNIKLATRFFVLPVTAIAAIVLLVPPVVAGLLATGLNKFSSSWTLDEELEIRLYRYSYPIAASSVMLGLGLAEIGKATSRWRSRIRDEVYLVGERLHNFGEKKPPTGSRSVVRKER